MKLHFNTRTAARAFGKVVDAGKDAARRWGVEVKAAARQPIQQMAVSRGRSVMVTFKRRVSL